MLQSVDPKRRERILQCFFIVSKNALTHNVMLTPSPLIKASVKDLGLNGGRGEGAFGKLCVSPEKSWLRPD